MDSRQRWRCGACLREVQVDIAPGAATLDPGLRKGWHRIGDKSHQTIWRLLPNEAPLAPVRAADPPTSHAAARSVNVVGGREIVLRALSGSLRGYTDEELYAVIRDSGEKPISMSGARTRRSELVAAGLVRDSGERRRSMSGRTAIVWEAVR